MRVGIIGGGAAGLVSAWLLEADYEVFLFEAKDRLAGQAHTAYIPLEDKLIPVELGFEFFNNVMFPHFTKLLQLLQIPTRSFPLTYTFHTISNEVLVLPPFRSNNFFNSLKPSHIFTLLQFDYIITKGRKIVETRDTALTLESLIEHSYVTKNFADNFFYPLLAAGWGADVKKFKAFSAYEVLSWLVNDIPSRPPINKWSEIIDGTSFYIKMLAQQLTKTEIKTSAPIEKVTYKNNHYQIYNNSALLEVDHLIVATNAYEARKILSYIEHTKQWQTELQKVSYFRTTLAIHADQRFMPKNPAYWSVANVYYDGTYSSLTTYKAYKSSTPLFRSWVHPDRALPEPLYALEHFYHGFVTPACFEAQNKLNQLQGENNLWLAGVYMHDIGSHEGAVNSAISIAQRLIPNGKRLQALFEQKKKDAPPM